MARCSICYTVIATLAPEASNDAAATAGLMECPECQQTYHRSCWNEIGGCGTYGCKSAAVAEKPPLPVAVGAGWGDHKDCPSCHRQIGASLLICTCGARFPWADAMSREEYAQWQAQQAAMSRVRTTLILAFLITLVGVVAPLTGPLAGIYAWRKRKLLDGTGGTYLAIGYGSAALGVFYAAVMALVALGA
jgi:hypothetical protein